MIDLSREQIEAAARGDRDWVADLDRQWKVRVLATQNHDDCRTLLETLARNRTWQVPTLVLNRGIAYLDDPDFAADPRLNGNREYIGQIGRRGAVPPASTTPSVQ